jgi:hypothetical protein
MCELWLSAIVSVDVEKDKGVCLFVFKGSFIYGQLIASKEGEPEWVNLNAVKSLPIVEDLPVLMSQVRKHKKSDPIIFARSFYDKKNRLITAFSS